MTKRLQRPNPHSYQEGECDGYDGGCHICAADYLEDLQAYRAEYVTERDAAGPCGSNKDAAYEAEFEIQWSDREIAVASRRPPLSPGLIYELPRCDPVVTSQVHADGSVTVTERWSPMWPVRRRRT